MATIFEAVQQRYSCRKYQQQEVELEKLKQCIEAVRLAPSACNGQPWHCYVVNQGPLKETLVSLTQPFTKNASFVILSEEKPTFQTKIVNRFKDQDYTQVDIGIAATHFCLAATELGLGTCMIGWYNEEKIKEALKIPQSKRLRLIISVGYPKDDKPSKRPRQPLEKMLTVIE